MLFQLDDQPELYHIDRQTAEQLSIIARQRNTTLKTIVKQILHKLYGSEFRSVYVCFESSYSIFAREGYSVTRTDDLYEDLTDIAGIVAFRDRDEPEIHSGIIDFSTEL